MTKTSKHFGWQSVLFTLLAVALTSASAAFAQPTLSKVFTPNAIGPGSTSTITMTITNASASPVTGLTFLDTLPVVPGPMTLADPANAFTDCDLGGSGALIAPNGGSSFSLTDAQIGGSQSCTITVDVTASTPGAHTNPAVTLFSSAGTSMSLPIDLTVVTTLPGFSKSFAPSSVSLGEKSTLTFTIDNSANASNVLNLDFTDNLPASMEIASPPLASTTCGTAVIPPTLTATAGSSFLILDANGTFGFPALASGATCTVTVDVVTTGAGMLHNVSEDLLADFTSAGSASDTLEVTVTPMAIQKEFTDDPVPPGSLVTLEFVINNFNRNFSATGLAFTDDLTSLVPALPGLTFASLVSNDCGGSVSGVGGTTIGLSGGTIAPEGSCTLVASLMVPGATPGAYTNTSSTVTATVDGSPVVGNTATDDLFVEPVPILTKEFLEDGTLLPDPIINPGDDVVIRFTVTNTSTTSAASDVAFIDELTNGGPGTGFLPFPVSAVLPAGACGGSVALISLDTDRQGISLTGGSLTAAPGAGATCTFDVTVTVPAGMAPGIYLNTTEEVTATVNGATRTGDPASDTLTVIAAPTLTKEFTDDPVGPGNTVTLEFNLTYPADASGDATDISFTDNLNAIGIAGLTANLPPSPDPPCGPGSSLIGPGNILTLMNGTLMPGENCTFNVTLNVPAGAAPGNYTNTTSGVGATVEGLPATSATASDILRVSGLVFTKEFLGDPVIAGDTLPLRFTLSNIHPTDDATITMFTDTLTTALPGLAATGPPSTNTCGGVLSGTTTLLYVGGTVPSGTSCTIEVEVLVPGGAADGTYLNITSSLTATQGGPIVVEPATDDLTVNSNLLQLTKAFTDDPVAPGDPVTLEFTLTNLDAAQPASLIDFSDNLGAALTGLTFDSVLLDTCGGTVIGTTTTMITVTGASVAAASSCTLRVSLTVPGGSTAGTYTNTSSAVTGDIGGFAVSGDPATDDLVITQLLLFSKSFDGPTTATGMATLTFTITNPGTNTATGLSFSDDLDAVIPGLIAVSLPALPCGAGSSITGISFLAFTGGELPPLGGTCSFDVDVLVPVTATAGTYPNTTSDLTQGGLLVSDPATADLTILAPPTFAKDFAPDSIGLGLNSTLTFTINNTATALAANALAFTDTLPAGIVVATPSVTANTCGGTLTATAGSGVVTLTGGAVGASATCTVDVDVTGTAVGALVNTTGDLTSSAGNSGTATDTLTVNPAPTFTKMFAPDNIPVGGVSTLTFTINNTGSTAAATGLDFTDNLPAAVVVATPSGAATTCIGGTLTAADGSGVISYTGGMVTGSTSCTVSVNVTSSTVGAHVNLSGVLTSSLGASGTATATLTVSPPPGFAKVFAPNPIVVGGVSTLTFTITNTSTIAATALDFTDNLPAAVAVATPSNAATTCTGGTLTATNGSGVITYTGGTVGASSSCTVTVDVTSTTPGTHVNLTGDLTSSLGNSGTATDTLGVDPPPGFAKIFAPDTIAAGGVSTLTFTIDNGLSTTAATGLDFTDNLPAAVIVATPSNAATTCSGGTLTAVLGSGVITYTGGTVSATSSCTVSVDVTSATPGAHVNSTGDLTSSLGNSGPASDTLTVTAAPLLDFAKVFTSTPVLRGGQVGLEFTITNLSAQAATTISFTDDLNAVLPGMAAVGLPTANVCGAGSQLSGTTVITLTGGNLPGGGSCVFLATIQVPATAALGTFTNVTSATSFMVSGSVFAGPAASADLDVDYFGFTKAFVPGPVGAGLSTPLSFTITNPDPVNSASDIAFTDDLDAVIPGMVAEGLPQNDDCGFGSLTDGTSIISLTGGSLGPAGSCTFSVTVMVPATATDGDYPNTTSPLSATVGASAVVGDVGSEATSTLTVLGNIIAIPTLGEWTLLMFAAMLLFVGWRRIRPVTGV